MESLTSPCLKLGGKHPFLSTGYIAWFCLAVMILGFYAVCWQLILENFVWASLIFHETITWKQILGIIVISIGMVISISDEHGSETTPASPASTASPTSTTSQASTASPAATASGKEGSVHEQ